MAGPGCQQCKYGIWGGYTYEWNAAQTDATLVTGGKSKLIGTQTWVYPNEIQCFQCHTQVARDSLGLETPAAMLRP